MNQAKQCLCEVQREVFRVDQTRFDDRAAALALGQDFDRETVDAAGADRARIVFPIILDPRNSL